MKVKVDFYTDPLCAWSYAYEPTIDAIIREYRDKIDFQFRSLPILDRIQGEPGPGEKKHTPEEMRKTWSRIAEKTGAKIDSALWDERPPHSSWPSNRATKAALRQGFEKGHGYLRSLRQAIMQERRNPSDLENLKEIAERSGLDMERFYDDMTTNAFEIEQEIADDKIEAAQHCVTSTPTLVMQNDDGDKIIVHGTLDQEVVSRSIRSLMGEKVIGAAAEEPAPSI